MPVPAAPYVFISYARSDRDRSLAIVDALEAAGMPVWVDRQSIHGGASWSKEIVEGIKHCTALVICCSGKAMESRNVRQEIQLGWRYEKPYLPLLVDPVEFPEDVLYFLEGYQWVEAGTAAGQWLPAVLKALRRLGVEGSRQPAAGREGTGTASFTATPSEMIASPIAGISEPAASSFPTADSVRARHASLLQTAAPFVGREPELAALRRALDEAHAGSGRLVLLAGEPGIGKTRLAERLCDDARERGALVLWGRCWEGDGAPAYYPWAGLVRAYLREAEPAAAAATFGPGAAEIAQLAPDLRAFLPDLPLPGPVVDPDQARFQLFAAVVGWLRALAARQSLVLVLDDLHWADKPSLALLQFLAQELPSLPVLVLGTYRDVELDRKHPLADVLATMRRQRGHERLLLHGLSEPETATLLALQAGQALGAGGTALAAALHRETEGNPFFLQETLRHLTESGRLATLVGARHASPVQASATPSIAELGIPEGVREVIGRRLSRLSEAGNRLLAVAAVVGREFEAVVLERVAGVGQDELDVALEEAEAARLVAVVPGAAERFRFSHALVRETLYEELPSRRRTRLHRQVGEALEQRYARSRAAHAAELAYHFLQAGEACTPQALRYSKLAAEQAEAATGWEDAARHYEHCLELLADGEPLGEDEADLLTALGRCARNAAALRTAWRSFMRAIDLYRQRGDGAGMARATLEACGIAAGVERQNALVDAALAALGDQDPYLEGRLLLATITNAMGGREEAVARIVPRLEDLVRRHGFADIAAGLISHRAVVAVGELRLDEALTLLRRALAEHLRLGNISAAGQALGYLGIWPFFQGELAAAEVVAEDALAQARGLHLQFTEQNILIRLSGICLARAEFERFDAIADGFPGEIYPIDLQRATRWQWAGAHARALALLPEPERAGGVPAFVAQLHSGRARLYYNAGDHEAARRELAVAIEVLARIPRLRTFNYGRHWILAEMNEALVALVDEELLQAIYAEMQGWEGIRIDPESPYGTVRLRGALALRLGRLAEAEADFRTGLAWAERERLPVEQGCCLQGLAEIAAQQDDRARAAEHLERAITVFAAHDIHLYLDRALARLQELRT